LTALPLTSALFPYTTLFRSKVLGRRVLRRRKRGRHEPGKFATSSTGRRSTGEERLDETTIGEISTRRLLYWLAAMVALLVVGTVDRKSTRLKSSHQIISYAV